MEQVIDRRYDAQWIASSEDSKTPPSDGRRSLALLGEIPQSPSMNMALVCHERFHACTGSDNSMVQNTIPALERWMSPSHGVASGREIAFYRDGERSPRGTGFEDPSNGEDLMLHMVKITLELLRELVTRNAEAHVKTTTSQQRRFHRFAQKAHRARRWIYRSVQQQGLTVARQQMQILQRNLDGPAEPSSAMAGGAGTIWALVQRYPLCIRLPSIPALVMRFLPEEFNRPINLRDRADVARIFVALVNHWLSEAGGEGALTSRGTMRQLASAEKSTKIVEAE